MAATGFMVGGEVLIAIIQAYFLAAKQQNLGAEQAKVFFLANADRFLAASAQPVEPVKEG
jgi:hypothetical protein